MDGISGDDQRKWHMDPLHDKFGVTAAYRMPRPKYHALIASCSSLAEDVLALLDGRVRGRFSLDSINAVQNEARALYTASTAIILPAATAAVLTRFPVEATAVLTEFVEAVSDVANAGEITLAEARDRLKAIKATAQRHGLAVDANVDLTPAFRGAARQANEGSPFLQRLLSRAPASE